MTLRPGWRWMVGTVQLVVPDAVPAPPALLTQVISVTATLSAAVPARLSGLALVRKARPVVGVVIAIVGAVVSSTSSTSTQSPNPSACAPGGVKARKPTLGSGEPGISAKVPVVGSYQRAVMGPLNRAMLTVTVRLDGTYPIVSKTSGARGAVASSVSP